MPDIKTDLENIEAFILDIDGVVYVGESSIKGSTEAVKDLKRKGKKLGFLTNNSTETREAYQQRFSGIGLDIDQSKIMTSAYATAIYLSNRPNGSEIYVIGEDGLKEELEGAGFDLLSMNSSEEADYVVVGMDRGLSYNKILAGLRALLSGAEFIATNPDPTYPTEAGLAPGAGASIGALSGAAESEPSRIIGKPSTYMIEILLDIIEVSPEKSAIVGDRIDLDIRAGKEAGLKTFLVMTGVSSKEDVDSIMGSDMSPDYVVSSLSEIVGEMVS